MLVPARNLRTGLPARGCGPDSRFPAVAIAGAAQTPPARERFAAGPGSHGCARPAVLFLVAAVLASAAVLLSYTREITLPARRLGLPALPAGLQRARVFDPHNEHIVVAPVLIYKALLALFGMDSPRPFQVASIATFLASAALLFVWLRRRAGEWSALGGDRAPAFPGRRLGGPAVAVSDRLLRLDGRRARRR